MRLLRVADQVVVEVREDEIPRYVSLSHTWGEGEVSFQEMERLAPLRDTPLNEEFEAWSARIDKCHAVQGKTGFKKIEQAANLARQLGYEYVWIDTCCIDKTSSVELSEAINSMYRWYAESDLCCAYLADVPPLDHKSHWDSDSAFRRSRWFTRGWTLQELIAPAQVSFFAKDWSKIDEKSNPRFCRLLADITGIDESVLNASRSPHNVSVASRMSWAASRQATRTEDIAYCLMGIFQVNMPLLYGEGHRAFLRLQEEILKEVDDQSLFAWDEPATESIRILGSEITLHGLLAASPALFSKKYQLLPLPPMELRDSTPLQITSQGLRASFYLLPARQGNREDYSAVLDCSLRIPGSHQLYSPVIKLRHLWGDQFARINTHRFYLINVENMDVGVLDGDEVNTEETDISRNGAHRTVYIRQTPKYSIPPFLLPGAATVADALHVISVYPPSLYDAGTMMLFLDATKGVRPSALVQLTNQSITTPVNIFVGLRRGPGLWEPYWMELENTDEDPEELYRSLASHPLEKRAHRAIASSRIRCTTIVHKVQRLGRLYLQLEVLLRAELEGLSQLLSNSTVDSFPYNSFSQTLSRKGAVRIAGVGNCRNKLMEAIDELELERQKNRPSSWLEICGPTNDSAWRMMASSSINFHQFSLLHFATALGDVQAAKNIIETPKSSEEVIRLSAEGWTIAHLVAMLGGMPRLTILHHAVQHLVQASAAKALRMLLTTPCAETRETPLHFMAAYGPTEEASALTNVILDPIMKIIGGEKALLERNEHGELPIHRACAMGNLEAVKALYERMPEIIATQDMMGRTPLWHAVCGRNTDIVRFVLNKTNFEGGLATKAWDPIHYAALHGNSECLALLIEAGADVNGNLSTIHRMPLYPLDLAAANGHNSCVKLLLQGGADKEARSKLHVYLGTNSPLQFDHTKSISASQIAGRRGHDELAEELEAW